MRGLGTMEKRIAGVVAGCILALAHVAAGLSYLAPVLRAESDGVPSYITGSIGIVAVIAAGSITLSGTLFGRNGRASSGFGVPVVVKDLFGDVRGRYWRVRPAGVSSI